MTELTTFKQKTNRNVKCKFLEAGFWCRHGSSWDLTWHLCSSRWMSVLQNSKEEALNNAFKGDDNTGENNIVQELTKEIISEVQRMTGNDVCCDCGAPGDLAPPALRPLNPLLVHRIQLLVFLFISNINSKFVQLSLSSGHDTNAP